MQTRPQAIDQEPLVTCDQAKTETIQSVLDGRVDEARERAKPTLLRIEIPSLERIQAGFFISRDGFFLTSGHLKGKECKITGLFGITFGYEHVVDIPYLNLSLMKVEGVSDAPLLRPIPNIGNCMPSEDDVEQQSMWSIRLPVCAFTRTPASYPVGSSALNMSMQLYLAGNGETGGPILSVNCGYFFGVLLQSNEKGSDVCCLSASSLLWLEIEREMQRHRNARTRVLKTYSSSSMFKGIFETVNKVLGQVTTLATNLRDLPTIVEELSRNIEIRDRQLEALLSSPFTFTDDQIRRASDRAVPA
ncbi:hypothetical protein PInf_009932 [Phytophthora infestans]|nr:hypothetical protein PInf_009932 [Phytophthora infestans]